MGQPRGQRKPQHQQHQPAAQPALPDVLAIQRGRFVQWQPAPVLCSAVTADGTVAAVGREDGQIELWDTLSWQLLKVISDVKFCFCCIAVEQKRATSSVLYAGN